MSALADPKSIVESAFLSTIYSMSALADSKSIVESAFLSTLYPSARLKRGVYTPSCACASQYLKVYFQTSSYAAYNGTNNNGIQILFKLPDMPSVVEQTINGLVQLRKNVVLAFFRVYLRNLTGREVVYSLKFPVCIPAYTRF